jgi:RNA polymerase sigma factor (sigma-70 family)
LSEHTIDIHKELVNRCKNGDKKAQQELYMNYSSAMFNVANRILCNREEAQDILQESFLDAFMKMENFRGDSSFGFWMKRIVINKSINRLKKNKAINVELTEQVYVADEEENEEEIVYTVDDIKKAMNLLSDGYRLVFQLYAFENLPHKEIAEQLGISEQTSKSQYSRAKKKIKEIVLQN